MDSKELQDKISDLERQLKPLKEAQQKLRIEENLKVQQRITSAINGKTVFDDADLTYSAGARCECGAGLAYPNNVGMHGAWYCADILTGKAKRDESGLLADHHQCFPFSFYEIKSENQPSANGFTTRPVDTNDK